jgi:hypothetical protein
MHIRTHAELCVCRHRQGGAETPNPSVTHARDDSQTLALSERKRYEIVTKRVCEGLTEAPTLPQVQCGSTSPC